MESEEEQKGTKYVCATQEYGMCDVAAVVKRNLLLSNYNICHI